MTDLAPKALLDLRGWALGIFSGVNAGGVAAATLHNAKAARVATMRGLGWVEERAGLLAVSDAGRRAIDGLLPAAMPRLTDVQREVLDEILEGRSTTLDLGYAPARALIACGAVEARAQRFGAVLLVPTDRAREWKLRDASAGPR